MFYTKKDKLSCTNRDIEEEQLVNGTVCMAQYGWWAWPSCSGTDGGGREFLYWSGSICCWNPSSCNAGTSLKTKKYSRQKLLPRRHLLQRRHLSLKQPHRDIVSIYYPQHAGSVAGQFAGVK